VINLLRQCDRKRQKSSIETISNSLTQRVWTCCCECEYASMIRSRNVLPRSVIGDDAVPADRIMITYLVASFSPLTTPPEKSSRSPSFNQPCPPWLRTHPPRPLSIINCLLQHLHQSCSITSSWNIRFFYLFPSHIAKVGQDGQLSPRYELATTMFTYSNQIARPLTSNPQVVS
jgi:hypothetical protein